MQPVQPIIQLRLVLWSLVWRCGVFPVGVWGRELLLCGVGRAQLLAIAAVANVAVAAIIVDLLVVTAVIAAKAAVSAHVKVYSTVTIMPPTTIAIIAVAVVAVNCCCCCSTTAATTNCCYLFSLQSQSQ